MPIRLDLCVRAWIYVPCFSQRAKRGGCMNYPELVGKGIQPPGFSPQRGSPIENRVAVSTFHRYLERVYSHPVFRHSAGVPLKNRVAVSPFHRYLERVYSHSVFHTSPSMLCECNMRMLGGLIFLVWPASYPVASA